MAIHKDPSIYGIKSCVSDTYTFYPPRRAGTIFHLSSIGVLLVGVGISLYRIAYGEVGSTFLIYLLPIIFAIPVVPLLFYRLSYLQNAVYTIERDRIRLQWGLRVEVIPTNTILWVQSASDLTEPIRYPWIRWPGSVLGTRRLGGDTPIEFMASQSRDLVLVATYERVFAISPTDPDTFLNSYQRMTELGSLVSHQPRSVRSTTLFAGIWQTPAVRNLLIISILFSLALIVWTGLAVPTKSMVSLGFTPTGEPRSPIPGLRMMLLPLLNTIFWVFNFFAGLLLSRQDERLPLAYLLWGSSALVSGLFLVATYFILKIS
jgi:hypothetical protein